MGSVKAKDRNKVDAFLKYLSAVLDGSAKSLKEVGLEIGYDSGNIISMWKSGATQVPLHKVMPLADAIGVRRDHLMRLAMEAYAPDILESLEDSFGFLVTDDERDFLTEARKQLKGKKLSLASKIEKDAFKEFIKVLPNK